MKNKTPNSITKSNNSTLKVVVSGGGTGGHIFPAISIANEIRKRWPESELLFVGAEDRMEMERVPAAGYKIIGLPVAGFDRKHILNNFAVIVKLLRSMNKARAVVRDFRPDIAVGVGGYASGPVLKAASAKGIATLIQEQNSYAGVTNRMLAKNANVICVAYEGMEKFFPKEKIVITGNPCRQDLVISEENRNEGYKHFKLNPHKKTILMVGGSLGAATLNKSIVNAFTKLNAAEDVQVLWQCGKYYFKEMSELQNEGKIPSNVHLSDFISRMDYAYSVADLVISRAGAGSISEFSILGKPVILVPSPNVAEDHQTMNAKALVDKDAAVMMSDNVADDMLFDVALSLVKNNRELKSLSENILKLAQHNSAERIVDEIEKILKK